MISTCNTKVLYEYIKEESNPALSFDESALTEIGDDAVTPLENNDNNNNVAPHENDKDDDDVGPQVGNNDGEIQGGAGETQIAPVQTDNDFVSTSTDGTTTEHSALDSLFQIMQGQTTNIAGLNNLQEQEQEQPMYI